MGVSLTGFCAYIRNKNSNKNSNDLTNKHAYNLDSQFLINEIPNYFIPCCSQCLNLFLKEFIFINVGAVTISIGKLF